LVSHPRPVDRFAINDRDSWFHHRRYMYPAPSGERRLRRVAPCVETGKLDAEVEGATERGLTLSAGQTKAAHKGKRKRGRSTADSEKENKPPRPNKRRKNRPKKRQSSKTTSSNPTGKSQKVVPPGCVLRTRTLRFYPTSAQRRTLGIWFAAARHTYNWALGVLKRQHLRGKRVISLHKFSLKPTFVTCHESRVPRNLRWLKEAPCSVREQAVFELAGAYKAAFTLFESTLSGPFPDIKFRAKKGGEPAITIPSANFSKQPDRRWDFYTSTFPGALKFKSRDVTRIIDRHPDGPPRDVKLTVTRTGKYYMHVPIYVNTTTVPPRNVGHLVAQDPGGNPFMNYYSPTRCVAGSLGLDVDLHRIHRKQQTYDRLSSRLHADNADYLPTSQRRRLLRRRLLLQEKVRNLSRECVNKTVLYFVNNYQYIHGSIFPVGDMVERQPGSHIRSRTRRDLLTWRHGPFKTALKHKEEQIIGLLVRLDDEAYTTQTCGRCGNRYKLGGSKIYHCKVCGYVVHRDINGARNQALKNCVGGYTWVTAVVKVGRMTLLI
jgi:putative transposase